MPYVDRAIWPCNDRGWSFSKLSSCSIYACKAYVPLFMCQRHP